MTHLNTGITSTTVDNSNIVYSSGWDNSISLSSDLTDFFELVLAALGYDITFEDFKKMSSSERNQLIRDIKLKTII